MDMDMDHYLNKRQGCISCEGASPVCNCSANEQCVLTGRYVTTPVTQCIRSHHASIYLIPLYLDILLDPIVPVMAYDSANIT